MSGVFRASLAARYIFRGNITSKRGNRRLYKGRNAPSMGHIAAGTDRYIVNDKKFAANTFVVPSLKGFKLKPYIAPHAERRKVARPELIKHVNFREKFNEQRQIRVAKQIELQAILTNSYKKVEETGVKMDKHVYSKIKAKLNRLKGELAFYKSIARARGQREFERNQARSAANELKAQKKAEWEERKKVMVKYLARRAEKIQQGIGVSKHIKPDALKYLKEVKYQKRIAKVKKSVEPVVDQQVTV